MKRKQESLNRYANEAMAAGISYGKKQAQEYGKQVRIGPVPEGYRKAAVTGCRKRKG